MSLDIERRLQTLERFMRTIRGDNGATSPASWTPAFSGTGTAGTFTYANQLGVYIRIGKLIFATGQLNISAITVPPVGNMTITGLPETSSATVRFPGVAFGTIDNFNYSSGALQLLGRIAPSVAVISLYESFDNAATVAVPAANFTNTSCNLTFTVLYTV